jgi:thymidine phosphorylase
VLALGGGRQRPGDAIDFRVGLSTVLPLGSVVQPGQPLLQVHAASAAAADEALDALAKALRIERNVEKAGALQNHPVVHEVIERAP